MKKRSLILMLALFSMTTLMAQRTVTGVVSDESGEGLIGASILVKGTGTGTVTDIDGSYSLELPAGAETLVFSYTGYRTQEVPLGVSNVINVTLETASELLDEVVVTGYGEQSRRRVTTNIASVDSRALENVSVQSFEGALQGRLPGVNITGNSGTLGAQQSIRVRGVGSINASNQPLFVVDGMVINGTIESQNALGGPGTNPLVNLDPNDIESVDVLKDAAAAAIYGSRGSNGVILITTKSGKFNQRPSAQINYYGGWSEPTQLFDMLDGQQYAELWNRAARAVGLTPEDNPTSFYDVAAQPSTNWYDETIRDRAFVQETSANVRGGTQTTKYYFGATYRDEDGYVKTTNLQRYSFRANIEQQISDKVTAGIQLNPTRTVNDRQNEDNNVASPQTYSALFFPNVDAYDENGNVRDGIVRTSIGRAQFAGTPLGNIVGQDITTTTTQILGNAFVEYRPIPKLTLRTQLSSQYMQIVDRVKQGSGTTDGFGIGGSADAGNTDLFNWLWNNTATYREQIGLHEFDVTVGFEMQREQVDDFFVSGQTFANESLKTLASAAEITFGTGTGTESTFVGFLGRVNYSFNNRLLLTLSARVDGSSRFGANNRYGFFPAASAGYILFDDTQGVAGGAFNFLKLRGSWGLTGNAAIGNFDARGLIAFGNDYNFIPGFMFSRLENADLTWETGETIDFGVEFGMFNDRLRGSLAYFIRDTRDLLLDVPLPLTVGLQDPVIAQNAGEIRNQGLEFDLNFDILQGDFRWTLGVNGATLDNEVRRLVDNNADGEDDDIVLGQNLIRVGETLGSWYLVDYAGVDPANGDALFFDSEGNTITSAPSSARIVSGSPIPTFTGGLYTELAWKGFDVRVLFQAAMGHQLYLSEGRFYATNMGSVWNQTADQLNAWTPENPDTDVPQARLFTSNGNQHSTRYLSDADFLRLKNLQVGYTTKAFGASQMRMRFFFSGQNLLTFTDFAGLDPEASGQDSDSATSGSIFFSRPQAKTYTFGVNMFF